MTDPDPVIAALSRPASGRARLRDLVAVTLYGAARREWEAGQAAGDPAAYAATWTPSRVRGLREQADLMLDAESQARSRGRLTAWGAIRRLVRTALAGVALLAVLAAAALAALRWNGADVGAALFQACVPMAPPRYVGQGR